MPSPSQTVMFRFEFDGSSATDFELHSGASLDSIKEGIIWQIIKHLAEDQLAKAASSPHHSPAKQQEPEVQGY